MKKFYMLLRDVNGANTAKRHESLEVASAEAMRLINESNVREPIYVLESIGVFKRPETPVAYIGAEEWDE